MQTDGDGCKHIVNIISTDKVCLYLAWRGGVALPFKLQEWSTANNMTANLVIVFFALTIADDTVEITLLCHFNKVGIAFVEEGKGIMFLDEIIEFAFGFLHTFKTTESL